MEELINEVTSIKFWVAVVLAGLIINLISSYLKPVLDKHISGLSKNYKNKLKAASEREKRLFNELLGCLELRNIHRQEAIFERARSVWFVSYGIGFFTFAASLLLLGPVYMKPIAFACFVSGAFGFAFSMKYVISSTKKWQRAMAAYSANKQANSEDSL
ncbi:MAG: hypothetical protein ACOY3Z_08015 [Thermodesulfobacteriota bacterium]